MVVSIFTSFEFPAEEILPKENNFFDPMYYFHSQKLRSEEPPLRNTGKTLVLSYSSLSSVRLGSYTDSVFLGKSRSFLGLSNDDVTIDCGETIY